MVVRTVNNGAQTGRARRLDGVIEVRAGVYVFFDFVIANVGACAPGDIALSVLTTVIGHQVDKGWAILDARWMAMSSDRGTQSQRHDSGYGQACSVDGELIACYVVSAANQEHGIRKRGQVATLPSAATYLW